MRVTHSKAIRDLYSLYEKKRVGKESLLHMVNEAEIAERVYNSNAIENSTLTLPETEKILLELETSKHSSLREVFEAKNLALVYDYISKTAIQEPLTLEMILLLHKMLSTKETTFSSIVPQFACKSNIIISESQFIAKCDILYRLKGGNGGYILT